jgi:hypothetical protein
MEITNLFTEQQLTDPTQNRIADVPVLPRHSPWRNASEKTITNDKFRSATKLLNKLIEICQIVTPIGVRYHDEEPTRLQTPRINGGAVPPQRNPHDASTARLRNRIGTIMRTVVRDDYLSPNPRSLQKERCFFNTGTNGSRLIKAWEKNGKFYSIEALSHTCEKIRS